MQSVCWVTPSPPPLHSQVSPADDGFSGEGLLHQSAELVPRQDCHVTVALRGGGGGEGASSDRYLARIFRHTAKELFNEDVGVLTYRTLRNKDFQEVTLERDGKVLLRFEAAYGFQNIQNVVLKL
uniref:Nuclear prelamin A recognition factor n=1 Tax=Myotis myotis TaxID=51298 RepID=A0A7J7Z592_MYOMY|nr:hypothetical protein mMyoMyo1_010491 [Myotis myotis]